MPVLPTTAYSQAEDALTLARPLQCARITKKSLHNWRWEPIRCRFGRRLTRGVTRRRRSRRDHAAAVPRAIDLLGATQTAIENLINRYVRPEQTKGRRRRPYDYRARV